MAAKRSLLDQMRDNPRADWTIDDIRSLARQEGLELVAPTRGSHYTLRSPHLRDILTIPYKRPIKVLYIRQAVSYALAHRDSAAQKEGGPT